MLLQSLPSTSCQPYSETKPATPSYKHAFFLNILRSHLLYRLMQLAAAQLALSQLPPRHLHFTIQLLQPRLLRRLCCLGLLQLFCQLLLLLLQLLLGQAGLLRLCIGLRLL